MSNIKNKYFTNNNVSTIIYGNKGGIYMKNESLINTNTLMNIKNQKVILYLTKVVMRLNYSCNNIIPDEKFQRAIAMFINRNEDFETIKQIIDWHVQNERTRYIEHLKRKRNYERARKNKHNQNKTLQKKKVA